MVSLTGGTATPTGSVAFFLCKVSGTALCDSGGTSVGSTNLTGTAYPVTVVSPTAYVTSAGRYCWRATWSGDSANGIPGSSDSSASECFTVNPVTPTLATTAGPDINLGGTLSDSAALAGTATQPADPVINLTGTGGAAAGGTITFKLYGPNNCTTLAYTSPTVAVSGNGTYNTPNPQFQPTAAGTYHWVAVYSGDSPNTNGTTHNADCDDANEDVVVSTVAVHVEQRADMAAERLGHRQRPCWQRQSGRHRVLRPLRVGGLQRHRHLQHRRPRWRAPPRRRCRRRTPP